MTEPRPAPEPSPAPAEPPAPTEPAEPAGRTEPPDLTDLVELAGRDEAADPVETPSYAETPGRAETSGHATSSSGGGRATFVEPRPPLARASSEEPARSEGRRTPSGEREPSARRPRFRIRGAAVRRRAVDLVATAVALATTVVVAVLAFHIVFVAFEANTGNEIVRWVGARAHTLAWEFKDVFQPSNAKVGIAVNYGLAGLVYLVAGRVAVAVVRRLG
ncbi:hypothetical protein [Actinomadura terrae]|uniref:hypothetical protein n=1 Tax=Actinomadura terrae TaxID=604353 RepID=UPI001FA6DF27|nr:hypothetical protein [Actinomadura terrae]